MNRIYMDNAATTPLLPQALDAMLPFLTENYGNPSGVYATGREARKAVEDARRTVALALNASPNEIYFTSCGTESDNWALLGSAMANRHKGNHIITTAIEHHAVLHSCEFLEKNGFCVTYVPVDALGRVSPEAVEQAMTPETILISVMAANNEIGTLQPIAQIGAIARRHKVLFHTDAVQAIGSIPVDVKAWQVDLLSLSAHKFHGPKGVGALYIRNGVRIDPFLRGGAQERGRRAGTENVACIAGLAKALEYAVENLEQKTEKTTFLRDRLIEGLLSIPHVKLNGHPTERLPGNVNVSIRYIEGEAILLRLDMSGVAASSGSACTSGSLDPSHVLLALGLSHEVAHGSVRFSLSAQTTQAEVDEVIRLMPGLIQTLRDMSPLSQAGDNDDVQ